MNDTIDDSSLDEAIRGLLAGRRPRGGAPAELHASIVLITASSHGGTVTRRVIPAIAWMLGLAAVAGALALVVVYGLSATGVVPGASPVPSGPSPTFDPTITGPGIVGYPSDTLHTVPWLLGGVAAVTLSAIALGSRHIHRRLISASAAVAILVVSFMFSTQPGVSYANAYGGVVAIVMVEPPPGSDGRPVGYVSAKPGDPYAIVFNVTNDGAMPVRVLGLVQSPPDAAPRAMAWAALWMVSGVNGGVPGPEQSAQFEPFDLNPGDFVVLYLVGRAGPCAIGHPFDPDTDQLTGTSRDRVQLAYSTFGLTAVSNVPLPMVVVEPELDNCSA